MPLDPEVYKQLIESFGTELEEHTQAITKGLLALEKNNLPEAEYRKIIEIIFRSAHNIKGTSYSLGMDSLGKLAHSIESLFSEIQKKSQSVNLETIDHCFNAVDQMKNEYQLFLKHDNPSAEKKVDQKNITQNTVLNDTHEYDSIRVTVQQIEKLSSVLEEMQINKIVMEQQNAQKSHFIEALKNFSILFHTLQEEVAQLRMVPIGNLLSTFPRYVRDLSHELNKNVEFISSGEDVKVDKAVLEGLKDPIIHLLRNAIDHGIEPEAIRKKMGKPEKGSITLEIKEEQALIKIIITDDGAGMDANQLAEIALKKNIVKPFELNQMTDDNKLELIFRSGFSTKDIITDVSGRGVGLDVVKSNIENLKGQITLSTIPGKQTTFTLSVPLSIATDRGLLIKSAGQPFVVPTSSVEHVMLIRPEQIVNVQGSQAIILENRTIPFRILSDILRMQKIPMPDETKLSVMIIKRAGSLLAFLVDEIIGEKEIVIKSFHAPLTKIPCVSGGTLLESNQVVLVLDPGDLMTFAFEKTQTSRVTIQDEKTIEPDKKHILIVDDSITTRTLEKNVLESKNYQVTVAVNGKEALDMLHKKKFSLVITDVIMPVMDGFTLTEQVKKSEKLRHLPVIIVTSLGSDAEKQRGIDVGADAYIVKNEFESGKLLSIVSQLV